jgi:hypothetical protein
MSNSSLVRSVPEYSKHKASGRAYARFDGRSIRFYGTIRASAGVKSSPSWSAQQSGTTRSRFCRMSR